MTGGAGARSEGVWSVVGSGEGDGAVEVDAWRRASLQDRQMRGEEVVSIGCVSEDWDIQLSCQTYSRDKWPCHMLAARHLM